MKIVSLAGVSLLFAMSSAPSLVSAQNAVNASSPKVLSGITTYSRRASPQENAARRQEINDKIADLAKKLKESDRERTRESNARPTEAGQPPSSSSSKAAERGALERELMSWKRVAQRFDLESQCGPLDDSQDVELYDGNSGPSKEFVAAQQRHVAQIQWREDLASRLGTSGDPGDVAGVRWCTGTIISPNLFLTAGHCFDTETDWKLPRQNGKVVNFERMAPLMQLNFEYQIDAATGQLRNEVKYPLVKVLEYRGGGLDYAVVEAGRGSDGQFPGSRYGNATIDASTSGLAQATKLTVIQHPAGNPKRVAAGERFGIEGTTINYADVDTLGGSSGSGILDQRGRVIGVHTNGGCTMNGGANSGVTLNAVKKYSKIIK